MLAYLLIEAGAADNKQSISVTGSDLMTTVVSRHQAEVAKPGSVLIDSKALQQLANTFPNGRIRVAALENSWVEFRSEAPKTKCSMKLAGAPAASYPTVPRQALPDPGLVDIGAFDLLLSATMYAMSRDENRANLHVLHIERDGDRVITVSTDGHRMSKADAKLAFPTLPAGGINLPFRSARLLAAFLGKHDGDTQVATIPGLMTFTRGQSTMSVKLADQVFPPWKQVMPTKFARRATVSKAELVTSIERALVLATNTTHSTVLAFTPGSDGAGELVMTVDNVDQGTLRETLGGAEKVRMEGGGISAMFNAQYVQESVAQLAGDTVVLHMNDAMDAMCITGLADGGACDLKVQAVVMPMRM